MSDWTSGYVADIGYTYGYYHELNPLRSKMAFLSAGLLPPESGVHCELGFGQGLSTNIHAAASGSTWYATDFNPAQAGFAQSAAKASGANAHLGDASFADFCTRTDLPEFDSIGLHGIWSWINDANRAVIVDFVRRKLKVGGVFYISYNTLPGWAPVVPIRDLLTEHSNVMGVAGQGIVGRIDSAIDFADRLFATSPTFAKANPWAVERFKGIKGLNRNYLAHEYFNRDWLPMPFSTMAQWLGPAKITYACSAHYLDHFDQVNLTEEQQALMKDIPDAMFRQTVRDFMVNQQFRRDYWVKGARTMSTLELAECFREQKVILTKARGDVSLKIVGSNGEANLKEEVYAPILDTLADHKPRTIGQIEQLIKGKGVAFAQITQAIMILCGPGDLAVVQDEAVIPKARKLTDKLNAFLIGKARSNADITFLASPVTGGGVAMNRFPQLFLAAINLGKKQPAEWPQFAWNILAGQNQRIVKDGKTLETPEENLSELATQTEVFAAKLLPVLKALQIA